MHSTLECDVSLQTLKLAARLERMEEHGQIEPPQLPSNRKFGLFFALVFLLAAAFFFWKGSEYLGAVLSIAAALFGVCALLLPAVLSPLNRLWFALGMLLGRIVSPIVLGLIFFVLLTPVSVVTRLFGRDALLIRKRDASSYWVARTPPGPAADSFKNQF